MTVEWLAERLFQFSEEWERADKMGRVDSEGGAQYRRVLGLIDWFARLRDKSISSNSSFDSSTLGCPPRTYRLR